MKASTTTEKPISPTLIVPRPRSEMSSALYHLLQFLLAPQTLWALLLVPLGIVLYQVATQFEQPLSSILLRQTPLWVLLASAALALGVRERLRMSLKKFFSPPQQQEELLLSALLEQMENFDKLSEAIYRTCQTLNEAYQATPIHFFFRAPDTRDLKLVYSYGAATEIILIPEETRLRTLLKREGQPVEYPFAPEAALPPTEQNWLERLQARMLVPVTGKDHRLLGLITLGERRTGDGYQPQDGLLLAAIGHQIAGRIEQEERRNQIQEQAKAPLATLARLEAEMTRSQQSAAITAGEALHDQHHYDPDTRPKSLWI
ncbi:MAG TPA: hypothetical protein VFZ34_29365 [Blastocatellia bacterium]|nr:hypothetical protein [Blastocatellia bacterium]